VQVVERVLKVLQGKARKLVSAAQGRPTMT
jgi:hypothetical protein